MSRIHGNPKFEGKLIEKIDQQVYTTLKYHSHKMYKHTNGRKYFSENGLLGHQRDRMHEVYAVVGPEIFLWEGKKCQLTHYRSHLEV